MKDFQKIDWKTYNRPPFYQQWLCRDDTLKLATFGDRGLAEVDDQILSLKDQWDLDNVKGHFLDRIGKLLNEHRNGNTDEHYRILLKLRRLLNTNDGSIPSIIKAIKFIYSSEVVHIVPDYPAGLIIEHDGESTAGLNFNKLLEEIIPAGVSFSTKELFIFLEKVIMQDEFSTIKVHKNMFDSFKQGVLKFNGRAKHDGHTLNPTEIIPIKADGRYRFNGAVKHKAQRHNAESYVEMPIRPRKGIADSFSLKALLPDMADVYQTRLKHNGMITANGERKFNVIGGVSDTRPLLKGKFNFVDSESITESAEIKAANDFSEKAPTQWKFDGSFKHNGQIKSASRDKLQYRVIGPDFIDNFSAGDDFTITMRYVHKHVGNYRADGSIKFNSSIPIPL